MAQQTRPWNVPERAGDTRPHERSHSVHRHQKAERTQMSKDGRVDKHGVAGFPIVEWSSAMRKNDALIHAAVWMEPQECERRRRPHVI